MSFRSRLHHTFWSRWWRKTIVIVCVLVGLYAAFGFFALPAIVQWQLPKQVAQHTTGQASIETVKFNPFSFDLQAGKFALVAANGKPLVRFKHLDVNLNPSRLFTGVLAFAWVHLDDPRINAAVNASGALNFAKLVRPSKTPSKPKQKAQSSHSLPSIVINDLAVNNGEVNYQDHSQSRDFRLAFDAVSFKLHNFSTQPDASGQYRFRASLGKGQKLDWHGTLGVAPLRSQGKLQLHGLQLAQFWPYISQRFKVSLTQGQLGVSANYTLRQSNGGLQLEVNHGKVNLDQLALAKNGVDQPLIAVPQLAVTGINFDLAKRRLGIAKIATQGGRIDAKLLKNGQLDLASLLKPQPASSRSKQKTAAPAAQPPKTRPASATTAGSPPTSTATPATPAAASVPAPQFVVSVGEVDIHDYGVDFTDASTAKSVSFELKPIDVSVKGYRSSNDKPITLTAKLGLNGGTFSAHGQMALAPMSVQLEFKLAHLQLSPFQPYVDRYAQLRIDTGSLGVGGKLSYSAAANKPPQISFDGSANVSNLSVENTKAKQPLLKLGRLAVDGIHYGSAPAQLKVKLVAIDKPFAQFIVKADHSTNISAVLAKPRQGTAKPEQAPQASSAKNKRKALPISVQQIKISDGTLQFADRSMKPKVSVGIESLGGTIAGLSTRPGATAKVDLKGEVGPYAPVSIKGTLVPLGKTLSGDIGVHFKNLALTAFSPYSGKFAGYQIKKGKADLNLHYKIHDGLMEGKNDVVLDQLTLGKRVDSPTAVHLPLKLALALLRDSHGVIHLNLPVHGDLSNPKFAIAPLIWKVFVNVLTKAATAPFHLLASLVSGSSSQIDHVTFAAGQSTLSAQAHKALDQLASALKKRPTLELDIAGVAAPKLDGHTLAEQQLLAQLRSTPPGQKQAQDTTLTAPDQKQLLALYRKKFTADAQAAIKRKPKESDAAYHQRVVQAAFSRVLGTIHITAAAFEQLATARAESIRSYLVKQAKLDAGSIFMLSPDLHASSKSGAVPLPLQLKAH